MDEVALLQEMSDLLEKAGVEIRIEHFQDPPKNAGGFCKIKGKNLVLLHAGASKPERARALFEVVERIGLEALGLHGSDLSSGLLSALNRRGNMTWPHKSQAPSLAKASNEMTKSPPQPRLCDFTTMEVGGRATEFVEAATEEEIIDAARLARAKGLALFPLGGGSNVVVSDDGVVGMVLRIAATGVEVHQDGDDVLVTAAAGEVWHDFAAQMTAEGFAGLECLGGIPGAVGATPIQNVGAYGQEVSQTITSVRVVDRETFQVSDLSAEQCQFVYRGSVFKGPARDKYIVLAVTYRLKRGGAPTIRYGELSRAFEGQDSPSLVDVFNTVVELRKKKSMVLDPNDENRRSCGSFFVNAQVEPSLIETITEAAGEAPPQFPGENGLVKVPSAWLIERAGLSKGHRKEYVGLSTKHTLSIVAHEGALARDVVDFASHVREIVQKKFGVRLTPEPHFWGFGPLDGGLPRRT